jgi:hypothetical protein
MPNTFAFIMLLVWPIVVVVLYSTKQAVSATLLTFLGAQLLLPVGALIKFVPMIPTFDKNSIPSICALVGCLLTVRRSQSKRWKFWLADWLIISFVLTPFISGILNTDPIVVGGTVVPAVGLYDALSSIENAIIFLIPFFIGRYVFRETADIETVMRTFVVGWLFYSVLILFEIRMGPQLHVWFYGYSEGLNTEAREGFMRPRVFAGNGLMLAFFGMTATVASVALWRTGIRIINLNGAFVTTYLSAVLVMCRSLGALLDGILLVPLVRFFRPKLQARVAIGLVLVCLLYPTLRLADLFPTQTLVELASQISSDRSASLEYRFMEEDLLLQHAIQRFAFGWGRFGRNRVYSDDGQDHSVTDGRWIITMGQFGFVGFLAEFGLIAVGVFYAGSIFNRINSERERILLAALSLIVAINLVECLPNSAMTPWMLLLAGGLLGRSEAIGFEARQKNSRRSALGFQKLEGSL